MSSSRQFRSPPRFHCLALRLRVLGSCGGEQMLEAGQEFFAISDAGGEAGAAAERDQLLAAQLVEQACIAREHHAQQRLLFPRTTRSTHATNYVAPWGSAANPT